MNDIQACSVLNYITEILNQFWTSKFLRQVIQFIQVIQVIHDSFLFTSEVSKFNSKNLMTGLDVESLFPNIALEETIDNMIIDLILINR